MAVLIFTLAFLFQDQKIVLPSVSTKFRPGMKLEAKDRQNPSMICVATVSDVNSNGKLLIHFDGWGDNYNYWCWPDTADIHPIGWCEKNQRPLHAPLSKHITMMGGSL